MTNFYNLPIADLYGIDDGYGVVGVGFKCTRCEKHTRFVASFAGDVNECGHCGQDHYVDKDYEY